MVSRLKVFPYIGSQFDKRVKFEFEFDSSQYGAQELANKAAIYLGIIATFLSIISLTIKTAVSPHSILKSSTKQDIYQKNINLIINKHITMTMFYFMAISITLLLSIDNEIQRLYSQNIWLQKIISSAMVSFVVALFLSSYRSIKISFSQEENNLKPTQPQFNLKKT